MDPLRRFVPNPIKKENCIEDKNMDPLRGVEDIYQ